MLTEAINSRVIPFVMRSAFNHLALIKPASRNEPQLYAGKIESSVLTMLLDLYNQSALKIPNHTHFFRFCSAFNQQWRAYDEVLDEARNTTDYLSIEALDLTPIRHPYLNRIVTGRESMSLALEETKRFLGQNDPISRIRAKQIEMELVNFRQSVWEVANNPSFHKKGILPYSLAYDIKMKTTGLLAEVGARMCGILLGIEDPAAVELFLRASAAMQYGDDLLDSRKDLLKYLKQLNQPSQNLRPVENLVLTALAENRDEFTRFEHLVLTSHDNRGPVLLKKAAPDTYDLVRSWVNNELDAFPLHPRAGYVRSIIEFSYDYALPAFPQSGKFYNWAKV